MSIVALTWIPIKKDAEGSAGAQTLAEMKDKILATPGLEHTYHAKSADPNEPAAIELFDVWSSLDAVKAAAALPEAEKVKAAFQQMADTSGEHQPYHNVVVFDGDFLPVAEAPIVHLNAIFLPLDVNTAEFEAAWKEGLKSWGGADGWLGGVYGWGQEEVDFPKIGKRKVFLAAAGWTSMEGPKAVGDKAKEAFKPLEKYSTHTQTRFTTLTKHK